jgi:hypothetical protein
MRLFNVVSNETKDNRYTKKIEVPQYAPSEEKPRLEALIDFEKYSKLLANINKSSVSEEEKKFLKFAAARHIVFRYSLIADYYAHASKEMQELMEQSALVILDIDDAIANGYVKLSKDIRAILEQSGEIAGEK